MPIFKHIGGEPTNLRQAIEHEHSEMMMPIVNSPRRDQCDYTGPAKPPY